MFLLWSHLELQGFRTQIKVFDHLELSSIMVWEVVSLFYIWLSSYLSSIYRISYLLSIYYSVVLKIIKLLNQLKCVFGSTVLFPLYKCLLCAWKLFCYFDHISWFLIGYHGISIISSFEKDCFGYSWFCVLLWGFFRLLLYKVLFIFINFL